MRLITIINSHTLRGCVDWNIIVIKIIRLRMVTPCVGVWIETDIIDLYGLYCESHPAWVCGLKQGVNMECDGEPGSHPAWVCGLKPQNEMVVDVKVKSHPAWVCGLKLTCTPVWVLNGRHTLRGCVDWNSCQLPFFASRNSHTLRGCVDWNLQTGMTILFHLDVTPCVGVWIETRYSLYREGERGSHPAWVCGLKLWLMLWILWDL